MLASSLSVTYLIIVIGDNRWKAYKTTMTKKRTGKSEEKKNVASTIMVQIMNSIATGKLKKYEPLEAREFVDFTEYKALTLENVKRACEIHYGEVRGSCDVLYSDRGPSCIEDTQIVSKKVFLVRFLKPDTVSSTQTSGNKRRVVDESNPSSSFISKISKATSFPNVINTSQSNPSTYPKSLSIADLLQAGKFIKPKDVREFQLTLESFDVYKKETRPRNILC